MNVLKILGIGNSDKKRLDNISDVLKTDKELFNCFQKLYDERYVDFVIGEGVENIFYRGDSIKIFSNEEMLNDIVEDIVDELVEQTIVYSSADGIINMPKKEGIRISPESIKEIEKDIRPQFTGYFVPKDISEMEISKELIDTYVCWKKTGDITYYNHFRQGLDILDLDFIIYNILSVNKNSISNWFPELDKVISEGSFFKLPKTYIIKLPLSILQTTRVYEYSELNSTTLEIINRYIQKLLDLDKKKSYFVKTGTYSSKFDFRNAKVVSEKEVLEIGSYLWYIQRMATVMAYPLLNGGTSIYGVSTTNEWCIREYIEPKDDIPTIYKGLPLRTEFRAFVDFDSRVVLDVVEYWHPEVMKDRFLNSEDSDSPHNIHDYIVYRKEEERLHREFEENKDRISYELEKILAGINLNGQYSIDIMKNGDDFYIIDMAIASSSALTEKMKNSNLIKKAEDFDIKDIRKALSISE